MAGDLPAGDGQRGSTPPGGGLPGAAQPMDQAAPGRRAQSEPRSQPRERRSAPVPSPRASGHAPRPRPRAPEPAAAPAATAADRASAAPRAHLEPQAHPQRERFLAVARPTRSAQDSSQSPAHPQREDSSQSPGPPAARGRLAVPSPLAARRFPGRSPQPRPQAPTDQEPPPPGLSGIDDDWDQEASLAAFVAEVEAGRAHGLVDPDDLYYGEPWDSELDLSPLDAVPGEERKARVPAPILRRRSLILRCPSWMQGSCPAVGPVRRPVPAVPIPAVPVAGHRSQDSPPGGAWDTALPGPALAGSADATAGADRGYAGTSDDELIGVLGAWARIESWAAAGRLSAVAELIPPPSCHPRGARHPRRGPGLVGQILRR